MELRVRTNAKVNLYLRVHEKLLDGFHSIETIFQSVSLGDELIAEKTGSDFQVTMSAGSGVAELPAADENIVTRAAMALAVSSGRRPEDAVRITKHIPLAAGLAGGSANAAGALVALQRLWGTEEDLQSLALGLGADVPFCLMGGTALATGKGEVLQRLLSPFELWFVLGISAEPLSTARVYSAWTPDDQGEGAADAMVRALASGHLQAVSAALRNDLEHPAFRLRPDLPAKKESLAEAGAVGVSLSGSGPTLFALATGRDHAHELAGRCRGNFDRVEVVSSVPVCVEDRGTDS